ncbi:MAG: helicase, partial [Candidatus Delongbacteria bacterium]|nr:helicase [Candidatus Delongbacteria bacterium]
PWVYNFSKNNSIMNTTQMINFFNEQTENYHSNSKNPEMIKVEDFVVKDEKSIKWDDKLFRKVKLGKILELNKKDFREAYRTPFCKEFLFFNENWNWSRVLLPKVFPESTTDNLLISAIGKGASRDFSVLISNTVIDYHFEQNGQCFPLYYYEEREKYDISLFDSGNESEFVRRDGISDFILEQARKIYGPKVSKEDIFYYVYGFLHSPEYRIKFANDLKKMLPRLPLVDEPRDFWKFSKAGRELAELHINYESVPPYDAVKVTGAESGYYKVEKMRFPSKEDKSRINYNSKITIENIPDKAYEYIVNGKSAIEWIMERYQVTTHKESGIKNDPNDWADEVGNPRYILDLLLSIITVSVQTVDIVNELPKVKWE